MMGFSPIKVCSYLAKALIIESLPDLKVRANKNLNDYCNCMPIFPEALSPDLSRIIIVQDFQAFLLHEPKS